MSKTSPIIQIKDLSKTYKGGFEALKNLSLNINRGEIFALLGPNGAGKTSLIHMICGLSTITTGSILVNGFNVETQFRQSRSFIGLVPQELHTDAFETVYNTVTFSQGLFGKKKDPDYLKTVLSN